MKFFCLLLICISLNTSYCPAQNRVTKDGLKYGKWVEKYEDSKGKIKATGYYKIVLLSDYDTLREMGGDDYEIKYKGATEVLFIESRKGDSISVRDGAWEYTYSKGKICDTTMYNTGIMEWWKDHDPEGNLTDYHFSNLTRDTSFHLTYINNQVFKTNYYVEGDSKGGKMYYPDCNLIISNAEISLKKIFSDTSATRCNLTITPKLNTSITSIEAGSENIKIIPYDRTFPCNLNKGDTLTLCLEYTPTPTSFTTQDTISIITTEENTPPYKIYCHLRASHIDNSNVTTMNEITLSRSIDKYLIIAPMGTSTGAWITNQNNESKGYRITSSLKIDLNTFVPGEYKLDIRSCHTGGDIKLVIKD